MNVADVAYNNNDFYRVHGKRILDLALIIIISPFFILLVFLISIAVFVDSGFPIVFSQNRVGKGGKNFRMYKFRTMIKNAQELQSKYLNLNEADGPVFKIRNDPRLTIVGKFLAPSGLDEILQVINVLLGHMSFVGPRPLPVAEEKRIPSPYRKLRSLIKPGITSSWVISGSHKLPFLDWMENDMRYVQEISFVKDIWIIILTIKLMAIGLVKSLFKIS
jgi:lipopolysaccharide/colanic/teichoic acid biosynthesis glycosyltransferase